jgi:hypothetical protein
MKRNNTPLWLIAMLYFVFSCKNTEKSPATAVNTLRIKDSIQQNLSHLNNLPTDIYIQAAIETCNCMQPMVEKAKKLKELEATKQFTGMKKMAKEMDDIRPQTQKCSDEIRKKYVKINGLEDEKHIRNALEKQCPDLANMFSSLAKIANK